MPEADTAASAVRAVDARAVQRIVARMAEQKAPPWLHGEVARRMAERLGFIKQQPAQILDWWGFLGASAASLKRSYPSAQRRAVEPTSALRARSVSALPWWSVQRWRGGDAVLSEEAVPDASAQLLWANMMLHAVVDPAAQMGRWHRALAVDGFLMFSTLGPGSLGELRRLYARLGWVQPMAELVDMHDLGDMLVRTGFADPVMDQETLTLTWASPQDCLRELRAIGGNAAPQRYAGLRTPRWRDRLLQLLHETCEVDGRLSMRFEIVYGHAFKPAPRVRVEPQTTVSLEAMRAMVRERRS